MKEIFPSFLSSFVVLRAAALTSKLASTRVEPEDRRDVVHSANGGQAVCLRKRHLVDPDARAAPWIV